MLANRNLNLSIAGHFGVAARSAIGHGVIFLDDTLLGDSTAGTSSNVCLQHKQRCLNLMTHNAWALSTCVLRTSQVFTLGLATHVPKWSRVRAPKTLNSLTERFHYRRAHCSNLRRDHRLEWEYSRSCEAILLVERDPGGHACIGAMVAAVKTK